MREMWLACDIWSKRLQGLQSLTLDLNVNHVGPHRDLRTLCGRLHGGFVSLQVLQVLVSWRRLANAAREGGLSLSIVEPCRLSQRNIPLWNPYTKCPRHGWPLLVC